MKLISIELDGYRRFSTKQKLHLDCRVIALLGPNEAGKTSILRALASLNDEQPFKAAGPSQDVTRGRILSDGHPLITAKFLVEAADHEALKEIEGARDVKWLVVKKLVSGKRLFEASPHIPRSVDLRASILIKLTELAGEFSQIKDAEKPETIESLAATALHLLKRAGPEIPPATSEALLRLDLPPGNWAI